MLQAKCLLKVSWSALRLSVRRRPYPAPFLHHLRSLPGACVSSLDTGLAVATQARADRHACVGIFIATGSRFESQFENGMAHFFEHIAFRSTNARASAVLCEQMAQTGARFRCFTTREFAGYYAECLAECVPLVFDILGDCVFNNAFAAHDIECAKQYVYNEMLLHDQDVNSLLDDYLHATAFQGTPLAQSVMGLSCNLHHINPETLSRYIKKVFVPHNSVVAAVGGVTHEQMECLANTYLSHLEPVRCAVSEEFRFTGSEVRFRNDALPAANFAIAVEAPSACDYDKLILDIAAEYVGGWDRSQGGGRNNSSRLARAASTEHLCDAFKSFQINYSDGGLWGIQFMAPSLMLEDMLYNIQDEWMHMCVCISAGEVERGKRALKSKLLWRAQRAATACRELALATLRGGAPKPLDRALCDIDRVSVAQFREVCDAFVYDRCPAVAGVGPTEGLPDYTRIRSGMYWLRV